MIRSFRLLQLAGIMVLGLTLGCGSGGPKVVEPETFTPPPTPDQAVKLDSPTTPPKKVEELREPR